MEIKTKKAIQRKKVSELEIMTTYLIYDTETGQSKLLIVNANKEGIILQRASNENSLITLGVGIDDEVNIVGKINDMTIIDVDLY